MENIDNYLPKGCFGNTKLTREYFNNLKHQEIKYEDLSEEFNNDKLWTATYNNDNDNYIRITNSVYPWRFSINVDINGEGEACMNGTIFICTVEEFESLLTILHRTDLLERTQT